MRPPYVNDPPLVEQIAVSLLAIVSCAPFAAAIGYFIYRVFRDAIRRRRRERGLCEKCAYDVTGVQYRCPECGTLIER